ncbi:MULTISPECIES: hypothetical protein [unclassified Ensifer]|uniref:hypothetical protein n=1 Tax=unclassified Ensifer TaxID=2633371 RepID=UPI0008136AA5|nr:MULTISPECIES: hypothetical protein [unclassified Ensifer]OCP05002.1 hypothetical protein BC362_14680 [Ensifer sp. LC14]OCP11839.1 hypothetical protein BC374_16325 [Ensifer sp. LC13]OCP12396.1 hypothetical protein BBX50_16525 [Ensifer sp. LC11]OCP33637.1 hypothetical protein BC364_15320 [Ensifer sp. LC499]
MAGFETFDKQISLATADIAQDQISAHLARFARQQLAEAIQTGAATPVYDVFVNGRRGVSEETVQAPGPILYEFSWWRVVIRYALDALVKHSPRKSGRYASSFIVIVGGKVVIDFEDIAPSAEVIITNTQPYVRKVQVGAMQMSVPARMFDKAKTSLVRRYGSQNFSFEMRFLDLGAGLHPLIPYRLKRNQGRRKDRQAGMPITYPAIIMNMVQ